MKKNFQIVYPAIALFFFAMTLRPVLGVSADPYIYLAGFLAGYTADWIYCYIITCDENGPDDDDNDNEKD